jgi:hypothetical protein
MSKLTEIQNQYQGYRADIAAAIATDPGDVEVVYKRGGDPSNGDADGIFVYVSREDKIVIRPSRASASAASIDANDVPALIKALREFFE